MWRAILLGLLITLAGCIAPQPRSNRTVAAYEVPLLTLSDRNEFLTIIRQEAQTEGLHVDAQRDDRLKETAEAIPEAKRTLHAAVWRGTNDDHAEAVMMDGYDHLGLVWIMFAEGEDVVSATRFRDRVMGRVMLRWPETLALPVMPTGSIPPHNELIKMPSGYKLDPNFVSNYDVDVSSPLVAPRKAD